MDLIKVKINDIKIQDNIISLDTLINIDDQDAPRNISFDFTDCGSEDDFNVALKEAIVNSLNDNYEDSTAPIEPDLTQPLTTITPTMTTPTMLSTSSSDVDFLIYPAIKIL